jgi:hypothetical protein
MSIKLKIKVKHLAEEARIIRKEEHKAFGMKKWGLQHHRKTVVRDAARQTQIAYAIVRGKERCRTLHSKTRDLRSDYKEITRMVNKYGNFDDPKSTVEKWFEA